MGTDAVTNNYTPEYHVIASYLVSALSYVISYLCALSIASYFLALADIKVFISIYT